LARSLRANIVSVFHIEARLSKIYN